MITLTCHNCDAQYRFYADDVRRGDDSIPNQSACAHPGCDKLLCDSEECQASACEICNIRMCRSHLHQGVCMACRVAYAEEMADEGETPDEILRVTGLTWPPPPPDPPADPVGTVYPTCPF